MKNTKESIDHADVAQSAERLAVNQQVEGSNPSISAFFIFHFLHNILL